VAKDAIGSHVQTQFDGCSRCALSRRRLGRHKWLYQSLPAGETVAPSLTLSIPADASGSYDVTAYATDGDKRTAATATVTVGEESDTATDGPTDTATGGSGPGLTAAGAVAALVGATLLARRRR